MATSPRLVGMVHLRALPGAPHPVDLESNIEAAVRDARVLADAGFDAVVVENYGDVPFHPGSVPPITVAAMTRVASVLRDVLPVGVDLGVNVLRNDAEAALAVATAAGAQAIRVNVHTGARVTDQGVIEGRAFETVRLRAAWGSRVAIWADVAVKHSVALGPARPLTEDVADLVVRGRADAVLVTGSGTGLSADAAEIEAVVEAAAGTPVYVASGVNEERLSDLPSGIHGVIVGTALKEGGVTTAPVDAARAHSFVRSAKRR